MDEGDARLDRVGDAERAPLDPVDADHAPTRLGDAAEHAHERRFAGAVFADQTDHFAAAGSFFGRPDVV